VGVYSQTWAPTFLKGCLGTTLLPCRASVQQSSCWTALDTQGSLFDTGWPSDTSASRPPSPLQGPMTRARAKALHDKVNLLLNTLDLEHTLNGLLPHCNIFCAVRHEPHGTMTKGEVHEEEAWKRRKKKTEQMPNRLKPASAPAIADHQLKLAPTPAIAGHTGYSRSGRVNASLALKPPM
jgi:hypothetical protein